MKAVELQNLSFSYEGSNSKTLSNASFFLEYGQLALLCGYSGQGKSTVISIISGIIPNLIPGELSGNVLIDGLSIEGKSLSSVCRKVGIVLQNADAQIIHQSVEDEIAFGCENFNFPAERISSCIDNSCTLMSLNKEWNTRALSGGQKQRLVTASTLATRQKILILDEPLANLDCEGTCLLMKTLHKLSREGYAVLVVEHRLESVLDYVDTVWRIENGKLINIKDSDSLEKLHSETIINHVLFPKSDGFKQSTVFEISNLSFSVRDRTILKNLNFNVQKGERLLLLGENGCGKTTLLRLLARLLKPAQGKIIQNINPSLGQKTKGSREWFRHVGVIYQNPNYQLFMPSVRQEISFGADSDETAEEIMELFGLSFLADRHPHSLSEGQKRRVSIAAVAASKPDVILLDEPTVGQDFEALEILVNVLNRLHFENGNTMITVTHDRRCAFALCDRCLILEAGQIIGSGDKELAGEYLHI